ncbi:NAD(P)H-binding protein [Carboxylicivirga linearis]|uniref:NAD(P)H-binding protein n=1 Tax=Carboxylicivirga linearis TaxID=1628157 RepID=A0ABS5JZU0_9BACT|nr:NAD(P)H-binding protein [Carboxylicivirga linearis]MBS2100437.1 NAD(P)H-binding protein [Carboxylicivirga linearis]
MGKTAIVIGATGLVGSHVVKQLLNDDFYSVVKVFTRRSLEDSNLKLKEYICDFDQLDQIRNEITGDVLFSAMGTTLKQAGSKKQQYKVDYTYQHEFAKIAAQNGVKQYVLVSSMSANAQSKAFYLRIKGELEEVIQQLSFEKICILRPSGLMGERPAKRKREELGIAVINSIVKFIPGLRKYRGIEGIIVAKAMINLSKLSAADKVMTISLDDIFQYA